MKKNQLKLTTIVSLLLLLGSVFIFMRPTEVNAGLSGNGTKFLGNVIGKSVPPNFAAYWNQITPEDSCKWTTVEMSRDAMNWSGADMAFNYSRSNGLPFKFHNLIWGSACQAWLINIPADEQRAEIIEWMQAAGNRYRSAELVNVVNEPLHILPPFRNAMGGAGSTGWDWVIWSFEQARIAFPNSKLLINEYNIVNDPNAAEKYITIINLLKNRGLIDGIGIECHSDEMQAASTSTIRSILDMLAATGLPIYVSELDLGGDDSTQLARYQEKFPVLWEHPAVKGVTLWGYIQGQTWKYDTWLVSTSGVERPALQWLRTYFLFKGTPTPTVTRRVTPTPTLQPTPTPTRRLTPTLRRNTPTQRWVTPTPDRRVTISPTPVTANVSVAFIIQSDWGSGCTYNITIKNLTAAIIPAGWNLSWEFIGTQTMTAIWNATGTQTGSNVVVVGSQPIPANGSVNIGCNVNGTVRGVANVKFNGIPIPMP